MADTNGYVRDANDMRVTVAAAVAVGECWQMKDGFAAVYSSTTAATSGDRSQFKTSGQYAFTKAAGFVALDGGRAYWDHSANAVTWRKQSDRDFYLGTFVGDATSAATECVVNLNRKPRADIDLAKDGFQSVLVGTPAAGGFGYPVNLGGSLIFELTATSEAQKVDALSVDGFATGANAIVEAVVRVLSDGGAGSQDVSIGVASATHASDADSIAASVFVHLNGGDTNIYAESDDGTTEVAATDTTIDYTEGSDLASRFEVWLDFRDPADVQVYVNGSNVLPSSVFNVNAHAGTWFLLVHVEKASGTDVYKLAIDRLTARLSEQNGSA